MENELVRTTMKEVLNLKYTKLRKGNHVRNCDRSLILRKKFAYHMLRQIEKGVRIINVDETVVGSSNFKRSEWCKQYDSSVSDQRLIQPRLVLVTAIDTDGRSYIALS